MYLSIALERSDRRKPSLDSTRANCSMISPSSVAVVPILVSNPLIEEDRKFKPQVIRQHFCTACGTRAVRCFTRPICEARLPPACTAVQAGGNERRCGIGDHLEPPTAVDDGAPPPRQPNRK